jgi:hypothetical protein
MPVRCSWRRKELVILKHKYLLPLGHEQDAMITSRKESQQPPDNRQADAPAGAGIEPRLKKSTATIT